MNIRAVCPVLVGRERELSDLEDALLAACRGQGGVMVLIGDAGIGKSRLARELVRRAEKIGCAVMEGTCSEAELALPYLPFMEAIADHLEETDIELLRRQLGSALVDLARLFPQLGEREPAAAGDANEDKLRLFEAILSLLKVAAGERGLLLVVEDLHWADAATRELLDYITGRLRNSRILVLATYRRGEVHPKHPLMPTIQGWHRSRLAQIVQLDPLPPDDVGRMVTAIFDDPTRDDTRDYLYKRCEGNPFVLEEMLKSALERGDIYRTHAGWTRKPLSEFRIPDTVRDTILLRLERLTSVEVEVLRAASVLGTAFDPSLLQQVSSHTRAEVEEALETVGRLQLVEEEPGRTGRYRFRHALTQEAIYENLSVPKRERLNSQAADRLATAHAPAVKIAQHLLAANQPGKAAPYCLAAAGEAEAAFAFREAAELWSRALPQTAQGPERARLLGKIGEALWLASDPRTAVEPLQQAIQAFEQIGVQKEAAHCRLVLGRCFWELGRNADAQREFELARRSLEGAGPSKNLALAFMRLGGLLSMDLLGDEALPLLETAVAIAEQAGADDIRIWSYNFIGLSLIEVGRGEEGIAYLDRSYQEAAALDLGFIAFNALYNMIDTRCGNLRADENWSLIELIRNLPWERELRPAADCEAKTCWFLGRVEQGTRAAESHYAAVKQTSNLKGTRDSASWLSALRLESGRIDDAADLLETPDPSSSAGVFPLAFDWMRVNLARDDRQGAARFARDLLNFSRSLVAFPLVLEGVVRALLGVADLSTARSLYEESVGVGDYDRNPWLMRARARIALAEDDATTASTFGHRSMELFAGAGYLLEQIESQAVVAEAAILVGDTAKAETELRKVLEIAQRVGSVRMEQQALRRLRQMGIEIEDRKPQFAERPPSQVGERLVTVLFADVRGYTEMSSQQAPSETVDQLAAFHRWAKREVERHFGVVDKFAGDAVMATFNISGSQVDHADHAVEAALALRDKAALLGVPVGIGIATGAATVGQLAEGTNMSVIGEATNLAARLQAQAASSEILLSAEARRRVNDRLDSQGLRATAEELQLKGFDTPVRVYRIRPAI